METTCFNLVISNIFANSFLSFESNSTTASKILNRLSRSPLSITKFRSSKKTLFCSLFNFMKTAGSTSYSSFTKFSKPSLRTISQSSVPNLGKTSSFLYLVTITSACSFRNGRLFFLRNSLSCVISSLNNFLSAELSNNLG